MEAVIKSTEQCCIDTILATRDDVSETKDNSNHNVVDDSVIPAVQSACNDAFELHRKTKQILSVEQQLLQIAQEELEETLRIIKADRQKINALQQEQTFTVRQIKDAMSQDVKRFEAILGSKQPDLLSYCSELTSTRDCLKAIRSIRDCKYHIQLAEVIIANRYAALLAERSMESETGGKKASSSAVIPLGSIPLTAAVNHVISDAAASMAASSSVTARKLRHLSLHGPLSSSSSSGVCSGKMSAGISAGRTQDVARSSSNTASNDFPGIVRIEIHDRDAPRPGAKDQQLLKPLAHTQSASGGAASKPQKLTKT